ncbi:FkbM family methyltransferase, partial [Odoribacter sp. OttesenSCG-928-L07]|nr:FkbM family methyltransferase [Odoribacter sp. OttesenSCG-928-L07]
NLILEGDFCIDIGANLGYYSYFMSKYVGNTGKVFAVEPIPNFAEIWKKNVAKTKIKNLYLFPFALGETNKTVKMGMPVIDGVLHHGMTKVISDDSNYEKVFDVQMRNPKEVFGNLEKIDFIKVDIEGYESVVFEQLKEIISIHKPLIQSELGGIENRTKSIDILTNLSYKVCVLKDNNLIEISPSDAGNYNQDFYFVTPSHLI